MIIDKFNRAKIVRRVKYLLSIDIPILIQIIIHAF